MSDKPLLLDQAPYGQASGWRRREDLVDALPYIDTLTPEMKKEVDKLIHEEVQQKMRKQGPQYLNRLDSGS